MCHEAKRILHLRKGLVIVKSENHKHYRVNLTRKTVVSGATKYGVTITQRGNTNKNIKLDTFDNISDAWNLYKKLRSA